MDYSKTPLSDLLAQQSAIVLEVSRRMSLLQRTVESMASEMDQQDRDGAALLAEGRY